MTTIDSRTDPRNAVLLPVAGSDGPAAQLRVDRHHPFFFDHPLDHVPGLLLLEGAVQLAQSMAHFGRFVSAIEGRFIRYALFEAPILLSARETGPDRLEITLTQKAQDRAVVTVTLAPYALPAAGGRLNRPLSLLPPQGGLLNKSRPENILIAEPRRQEDRISAWMLPLPETCLLTDSVQAVHPLCLLEGFMQVQRWINSQNPDAGRMRDILTGVSFRQYAPVLGRKAALHIDGTTDFTETAPNRFSRAATLSHGGIAFAECALHTAVAMRATRTG